jgi:predicted flap endonuclease-1-like 5' DNA nuclease
MPNGVDFTHHRALDDSCATLCVLHAMAVDFAAMNGETNMYSSSCVLSFLNNFGVKKRALIHSPKSRRASTVSVADKTTEKQRARFYNSIMHAAASTDVCKPAKAVEYKVSPKKKKKTAVVTPAAASAVPVQTPERVSMCVSTLKGVGDVTKKKLNALGIHTVQQLKEKRRELGAVPFLAFLKQVKVYKHRNLAGLIEKLI